MMVALIVILVIAVVLVVFLLVTRRNRTIERHIGYHPSDIFDKRGLDLLSEEKGKDAGDLYDTHKWEAKLGAIEEPDPVYLAASAPQAVRPGDHFTARFVAYIEEVEKEIEAMLIKLSPRAEHHLHLKRCRWEPGTSVTVRVYGKHLVVAEPEEKFVWEGESNVLDFDVEVLPDAPQLTTVLKFDVMIDGLVIARLRLDLEIGTQPKRDPDREGRTCALGLRLLCVEGSPASARPSRRNSKKRSGCVS